MRVSSAAIFTLASVTTGTNIGQAIAAPKDNNPNNGKTPQDFVIPVLEVAPSPTKVNTAPETTTVPQFSQKPTPQQNSSSNNSVPIVVQTLPRNQNQPQIEPDFGYGRIVEFSAPDAPIPLPVPRPGETFANTQLAPISLNVPQPGKKFSSTSGTNNAAKTGSANQKPASASQAVEAVKARVNSIQPKEPIKIASSRPVAMGKARSSTIAAGNSQNQTNSNNSQPQQIDPVTVINTTIADNSSSSNPVNKVSVNSGNLDPNLVVPATDVEIRGGSSELDQIVRQVIQTQAGGDTSQSQLNQDVAAVLDTGLFRDVRVNSNANDRGLQVTFEVEPIVVRNFQLSGNKVLDQKTAFAPFANLTGQPISPETLKAGVEKVNQWYQDNGYKLARVVSITPTPGGTLTMNVSEGVVNEVKFKFLDEDGKETDNKGKPVQGRTKPDFLRKQLKLASGDVFKEQIASQDLQKLYAMGLFESVNVRLDGDANKTDIIYELKEIGARSINVGGNYNSDQGLMGTFNYQDRNIGGVNDVLGVNVQLGRKTLLFDTTFSSPYRASEPNRIGYTIKTFRNRGISDTFDSDVRLPNGDRVREGRIGASVSFERPIDGWDTSLGFNYTRVSARDRDGTISPTDELGNPLTFSSTGIDDLATVSFTAVKDRRDNPFFPTSGSFLKLSTEQSVPFGNSDISMNRLQANYTQYSPVQVFKSEQPQVFALNLQAGAVFGDLPPYESFNLGGPNSVRGFDSGDVASARTYVLASAEYRFPILSMLGGVLFADFASDLGTGETVLGNPGGVRGKPGTGFGYGAGVRVNSPLGVIRADYGIGSQGDSRLHFGLGQSF